VTAKPAPQGLKYAKTHEWVRLESNAAGQKVAVVGITAFALEALTDLVFVDLPQVGRQLQAGKPMGEIESVKAVSDIYSPVDGHVVEVNSAIVGNLQQMGEDPYGAGWLVKVAVQSDAGLAALLDEAAYAKQCAEEAA
jgi:glycine cleavage system H protein